MHRLSPTNALLYPAVALLFLFLVNVAQIKCGIQDALRLSFIAVVPSVFPFAVLSGYIMGHIDASSEPAIFRPLRRLLSLPVGGVTCLLIGLLCGFPLGAKCVADGYRNGLFSKSDAERMLLFCNNTGPAFLVGGIGGMLGSASVGWTLYGIQTLLVLLVALLTRTQSTTHTKIALHSTKYTLVDAVKSGTYATLSVLGFVLFFSACISVAGAYLPSCLLLPLACILEVSTASRLASRIAYGPIWIAFSVCFSGVSVHMQTAAVLEDTPLSLRKYLITKMLLGFSGALLSFLFFRFL